MTFGRDDIALERLLEVDEFGDQYGNNWLTATAGTQLATLAVRKGDLTEARTRLVEAVDSLEDSQLSTLSVTFALVAFAELALAQADTKSAAIALGAASGLRLRAGLHAWPITRRLEADLLARVTDELDPETFKAAFEAGSDFHLREALSLVRERSSGGANWDFGHIR